MKVTNPTTPTAAAVSSGTAAAVAGGPHPAAATPSNPAAAWIATGTIEGHKKFLTGDAIPDGAFSPETLGRLIKLCAVVPADEYVEAPRPGSLSPDSASRFVGTFIRAAVDLLVEPLNGNELRVPQGRVFFAALNVAETAWRAELAGPAGVPGEKDSAAIFSLTRDDAGALFRDWRASGGHPFTTCATGFAMRVRKAPEPLPAAPPILVGAAPLAVAKEPPLPAAFTARPLHLS